MALALDGSRVAFANSTKVVVWNTATGRQTKVGLGDPGISQLALVGSRVAWLTNSGGNEEMDQYLYASSLPRPKQQQVTKEVRSGNQCGAGRGGYQPACAGTWLGGIVGSGNRILVNRWTTDTSGAISNAGLYALKGTTFKPVATGPQTVQAAAADSKRVAVLQWRWLPNEKTIHIYSVSGKPLASMTPNKQPEAIALSGSNLVVLTHNGQLFHYDARTGSLLKTFTLHSPNQQVLAVQGNIAVYATSAIHALNLATGKDRPVGSGQVTLARLDSTGLVYTTSAGYAHNRVVFVPFKQVAVAVGG